MNGWRILDAAHLQTAHMEFKFVAYNEKQGTCFSGKRA